MSQTFLTRNKQKQKIMELSKAETVAKVIESWAEI